MPTSPAVAPTSGGAITTVATLFGPPSVQRGRADDVPLPVLGAGKPLVLLARLILDRKPITREATMAFLWPEMPEIRARASLRQALHLLRQALGPDVLESDRHTIALAPEFPSDVDTFQRSVAAADDEAVTRYYGGLFLENLSIIDSSDAEQWIEFERRRLARLFQDAAFRRTSFLIASGQFQNAVILARRLRDTAPTVARFWRPLATALNASGNLRELASERAALRAYVDADLIDDPEMARAMLDQPTVEDAIGVPADIGTPERHESDAHVDDRHDLIGCHEEREHLAAIWQRAAAGRAERCLIVAPDGAGKSTLLRAFAARIPPADAMVIAVDAERWMRDDRLSYVSRVIEQLVELPAAINVSRQSATCLAAVTPTVRRRLPADLGTPDHRHPSAVTAAVRELLTELAGERALVLVLDDLHAADPDSQSVLGTLLDDQQAIPVFMLAAVQRRTDPAFAAWPVRTLEPFGHEQTAVLLSQVTGANVSPDVVEPIHRAAAGRPLIARQTVHSLREDGQLRLAGDLVDWAAVPTVSIDPHGVFPARLARRSPEERGLLDVVAVAGCPLPVSLLSDLLPPETDAPSVVQRLVADNLLAVDGDDAVRIVHDRIAVAVLRAMSIDDRRTIARRVGLALAARASTFHEMRRVMQLLIVAEAPTDIAQVLDGWSSRWGTASPVAVAVTETFRVALHLAPPPDDPLPQWRRSARTAAAGAATIGALALALALLAVRC